MHNDELKNLTQKAPASSDAAMLCFFLCCHMLALLAKQVPLDKMEMQSSQHSTDEYIMRDFNFSYWLSSLHSSATNL